MLVVCASHPPRNDLSGGPTSSRNYNDDSTSQHLMMDKSVYNSSRLHQAVTTLIVRMITSESFPSKETGSSFSISQR